MIPVEIKPDYLVLLIDSSKAVASITLCWNFELNNFENDSYVASRLTKVFFFFLLRNVVTMDILKRCLLLSLYKDVIFHTIFIHKKIAC